MSRVRDGKFGLAYKLYRNATVFPAIVSELCAAPCRAECQRGTGGGQLTAGAADGKVFFVGDEPVNIRAVEAATVRFAKNRKPETYRIPPRAERVAIIGAGLAGLSLALNLSQKAYPVTVFERGGQALPTWAAHPKYEYFLEEIRLQFSQVKTEFVYDREISGRDDPALAGFTYIHDATNNAGIDAVTAIANGIELSKDAETFLQTGKWPDRESTGAARPEKHYVDHRGELSKPIIVPADADAGHTDKEASLEAARCMGCDCRACMDACEMLGRYNKRPQKIAIEAYSDTKTAPPFSSCTLTRETYSCNLCGHCRTVCPVGVDMEKIFNLARQGRAETGKHPKAFHDFWLRDFEWHRTKGAYFASPKEAKHVFFPGCKLGARSPSQVKNAAAFLKERYGAGVLLDCCGTPAYWAGEDMLFQTHIGGLREKWEAGGKPVFVFACAYCMRLFSEFLPDIEKISLYELLAASAPSWERGRLARSETQSIASLHSADASGAEKTSFTVFDPCTARDFPEMESAVRKLAVDKSLTVSELPNRNHCCGYGGHMRTANPDLYNTIVERRSSANEAPYLVYCANCAETFALSGKAHAHILDLAFNTDDAARAGESLQRRRDNAVFVKAALIKLYDGGVFTPPARPWDKLRVKFPDALSADMNKRLILLDDVKEAIYESESARDVFVLPDGAPGGGELRQCRLVREVVTIWAQYTKHGNDEKAEDCEYAVVDVWNHRMRFSDTPD